LHWANELHLTKSFELPAGSYHLIVEPLGGASLFVDGTLVEEASLDLEDGKHAFAIVYQPEAVDFEPLRFAARWSEPEPSPQNCSDWYAEHFATEEGSSAPDAPVQLAQCVQSAAQKLQVDWGFGGPFSGDLAKTVDRFSSKWLKRTSLSAGLYRFDMAGDDAIDVFVTAGDTDADYFASEKRIGGAGGGELPGPYALYCARETVPHYVALTHVEREQEAWFRLAWERVSDDCGRL
jgi:hypothetical protein